MNRRTMSLCVRLYRLMIALLPRPIRERDGDAICSTFAEQLRETEHRAAVAWRACRRFPALLLAEWYDHMTARATPRSRRDGMMETAARLFRQATRSVLRAPAFSAGVVLLLGLGVGSVSAIFAVVDHVLLRELPYPSSDRLFVVENGSHSMPMFRDMQSMQSVEQWAAAMTEEANLTGDGEPLRVLQAVVTEDFFSMFGARPVLGRLLNAEDARNPGTVVLSYGSWQTYFGGDRSIVGRTLRINGEPLTVVGVLHGSFAAPEAVMHAAVDVWRVADPAAELMNTRDYWAFGVAGRLAPGATLADAAREAEIIAADRAKAYPNHYLADGKPSPLPVVDLQEATIRDVRNALKVLFAAVTLLLLVACANVTHLFLARGIMRVQEMSVRRSLGANTRALAAQLFTESMVLGIAGALSGVLFAHVGLKAFLSLLPGGLPRAGAVTIDLRILAFSGGIGILTVLIFGLLPAVRFTRTDISNPMRSGSRSVTAGRSAQRLRSAIVVMEVALSLVLVAQAGWLLRSYMRLTHEELGFRTDNILTMPMAVPEIEDPAEWYRRMDAVRAQLAAVPGVEAATFGLTMPLEWTGGSRCCWGQRPNFEGKQLQQPSMLHPVSEEYFGMLDMQLVAGGGWDRVRAAAQPYPAVLTETLAREAFGDARSAVGRTFSLKEGIGVTHTVVGVVADNRHYGASADVATGVYVPANTMTFAPGRVHMAVLTQSADEGLPARLREAIWRAEPSLPVPVVRSLEEWSSESASRERFESALFALFGIVTLLLVAAGLAGTLFYMVSLQRRDMGIRLALGATGRRLERVVLTRGVGLAAAGTALGAGAAWMSGKVVEARLYGVEARDLGTLGLSVAVLLAVAILSSWIPARRAGATNPMESLRAE